MIDDREVHVARQEVLADALGHVRVDLVLVEDPRLLVLLEDGPVGIDAPHLERGVLLLQEPAHAADRAAGADADHEMRDGAVGLIPDLGSRLLVVRLRIRRVAVLVGLPRTRDLTRQTRGHRVVGTRILWIDVRRAHDDLGAKRLQRVELLLRLLVSGGEHAPVALDDGRNRQAHAGVARRALDDRSARLQQTGTLGVLHHLEGHAVLGGIPGIEGLELREDRGGHESPGDVVDADHRRVANGVEDRVAGLLPRGLGHPAVVPPARRGLKPTTPRWFQCLLPASGGRAVLSSPGCDTAASTPCRIPTRPNRDDSVAAFGSSICARVVRATGPASPAPSRRCWLRSSSSPLSGTAP